MEPGNAPGSDVERPQNLVGTGLQTGDVYRDVGGIQERYAGGDNGGTAIMVDEAYRMITPGATANFFYRFRGRVVYAPDGEPVVDWVPETTECR